MSDNRHVDVVINDKTRLSLTLGWIVAVLGAIVTGALYIHDIKSTAASGVAMAIQKSNSNELSIEGIRSDVKAIRDSQQRIEGWISAQPNIRKGQ